MQRRDLIGGVGDVIHLLSARGDWMLALPLKMTLDDKFDQRRLAGRIEVVDQRTFKAVTGKVFKGSGTKKRIDVTRGRFGNAGPKLGRDADPFAALDKLFGLF